MQAHQERVVIEHKELDEKLFKLNHFIKDSPIFKGLQQAEQDRLVRQQHWMTGYHQVLAERIAAFVP